MGGFDVVRPLTLAGVECSVFTPPHDPTRWSRRIRGALPYVDPGSDPEAAVSTLLSFALAQPNKPVLYPANDGAVLLASRWRARLAEGCHLTLAGPELIEDLLHKDRFAALAERLELPVPRSRRLRVETASPGDLDLRYPIVVKPIVRTTPWLRQRSAAKAMLANDPAELALRWSELTPGSQVPGPEGRIESHHAYVDHAGRIAGEFTGRKIRTYPRRFGESTAIEITEERDVARLGRDVLERIGLRGVAKLDFKRAPDGSLTLLEVNPRFNLWHYPGALAGVNLPALVHADLAGTRRPPVQRLRAGVRWCDPLLDPLAAHADGVRLRSWLRFAMRCEAISGFGRDDPLPLVRRIFNRPLGPQIGRVARRLADR
jgi:predicted ATP-grasp superfamily ATP-dependent carboligase